MKQLIGLDETATPNDAFSRITLGNKRYGVNLYVKYEDGMPASGITITSSGSRPINGSMVTDENGYLFLAQDSPDFTASIDNAGGKIYIDLATNPSVSETLSETITTINMTWNFNEEIQAITSSKNITISDFVTTFDVCAVGGGGGGSYNGASGGGGGYIQNSMSQQVTNEKTIQITVGSGGSTGYDEGNNGGLSKVQYDSTILCYANGGNGGGSHSGGSGNGTGGAGTNSLNHNQFNMGDNGTASNGVYILNDQSLGSVGGGGGGGSIGVFNDPLPSPQYASGGSPHGGRGACAIWPLSGGATQSYDATAAGIGGGGGGGCKQQGSTSQPTSGGQGVVYLRFHH